MSDLQFVSFSDDGKVIILQNQQGEWIEVPVAAGQHLLPPAAAAADTDVELTPREIQARIRAGASPEALAAQSGAPLERIMLFAPPIVMERRHVAEKASKSVVRRANGSGVLLDVVAARLEPLGVDVAELNWDAFRRDDGRWTVQLSYPTAEGYRVAAWLFDVRNSALVPADDEARWLVGEPLPKSAPVETTNPTLVVPRLALVRDTNIIPTPAAADSSPAVTVNETAEPEVQTEDVASNPADVDIEFDAPASDDDLPVPFEESAADYEPAGDEPQESSDFDAWAEDQTKPSGRLPSWDEILFGRPASED